MDMTLRPLPDRRFPVQLVGSFERVKNVAPLQLPPHSRLTDGTLPKVRRARENAGHQRFRGGRHERSIFMRGSRERRTIRPSHRREALSAIPRHSNSTEMLPRSFVKGATTYWKLCILVDYGAVQGRPVDSIAGGCLGIGDVGSLSSVRMVLIFAGERLARRPPLRPLALLFYFSPNSSRMKSLTPSGPFRSSHTGPFSISQRTSISRNGQQYCSSLVHSNA